MSKTNCVKCDLCGRRRQCNLEGRLITYFTLDDMFMDPEYEKDGNKAAHGMLKIDEVCPLKGGENVCQKQLN